jgi:hypothetical protein
MIFNFDHLVTVSSVNVRKENHGEDRVLAVDITVEAESVPAATVAPLFQMPAEGLEKTLWNNFEDKIPKLRNLGAMPVDTEYVDTRHVCEFDDGLELKERPYKIDKFKVELQEGARCKVKFRMAFQTPQKDFVDAAMDLLKDEIGLSLHADPDLVEQAEDEAA